MQTLSEIARRIADQASCDEAAVFNQLRGLQQRGHLRAAQVVGGVQRYSFSEQMMARILIAALDADVRGPDVALVEDVLRNGRRLVDPLDAFGHINLEANLSRIRSGEDWLLELGRHRYCGEKFSTAHWVRRAPDGRIERFDHYASPLKAPYAPPETRLFIEVTRLVLPLIGGES